MPLGFPITRLSLMSQHCFSIRVRSFSETRYLYPAIFESEPVSILEPLDISGSWRQSLIEYCLIPSGMLTAIRWHISRQDRNFAVLTRSMRNVFEYTKVRMYAHFGRSEFICLDLLSAACLVISCLSQTRLHSTRQHSRSAQFAANLGIINEWHIQTRPIHPDIIQVSMPDECHPMLRSIHWNSNCTVSEYCCGPMLLQTQSIVDASPN